MGARLIVGMVTALALLTLGASQIVHTTTRAWFERDMTLRAQLAVSVARHGLAARWHDETSGITGLLEEVTHDERIMAAAACDPERGLLGRTADFPTSLTCEELGKRL